MGWGTQKKTVRIWLVGYCLGIYANGLVWSEYGFDMNMALYMKRSGGPDPLRPSHSLRNEYIRGGILI